MQTLTHVFIGAALGVTVFPNDHWAQLACAVGAGAPDGTMVPQFIYDKIRGRKALEDMPWFVKILGEITHSFVILAIVCALGRTYVSAEDLPLSVVYAFWAFCLGWLSHIVIDIFTHGDAEKFPFDYSHLWPLPWPIRVTWWDYRYDSGKLWPLKPFENAVFWGSISYTVTRLIFV